MERQPGPQDEKDLVPQETRGAGKQPERLGKKEQGLRAGARGTASSLQREPGRAWIWEQSQAHLGQGQLNAKPPTWFHAGRVKGKVCTLTAHVS